MADEEREARREARDRHQDDREREREAHRAAREREREALRAVREREREARKAEKEREQEARKAALDLAGDRAERLPAEIEVLWRGEPGPRRGPRPGLTLDDIADAGIAIADAEGLEAVSMARVADHLGYTAMSLYRYVSSKDEVVALMVDRASGDPPATDPAAGWRARLEALALAQLPGLAAHPWMTSSTTLRNTFGPHRFAWMEALVAALDGTPLSGAEKLAVAGAIGNQALADVRTAVEATAFARRARERGEAFGVGLLELLVGDSDEHPALAAALADEDPRDPWGPPPGELTYGLRLLLDGVAAHIAAAGGATPARR